MSLLPSRGPDTSDSQDGELQVVGVDEDIDAVLDALSSETARDILNAVYDEPGTPSELADRLDMSIQKVSYHLEKLESEELIAVAGTQYSEKGQEMTVYEPPEDPLVVFVGTPDRKRTLRSLVERLVPAIGLLTAASVMVQAVFGTIPGLFGSPESPTGSGTEPEVSGGTGGANETTNTTESTPDPDSDGPQSGAESTEAPEPTDGGGGVEIMETNEQPTETPTPDAEPSTPVEMAQEATDTATAVASGGGFDLEPGVAFFLGGLLVIAVVGVTWAYTS
ncbi:helix-turn-helix domain-containing protein [Haloarcula salinisoli]|uniref:Helix-turn-helix domain-containing protein n=1 Tax=Haloarcula salinisoli TaxID=2487746 RepID=A0A8J8C7J7_9EURY|nr:helix-turn-helix domain-containing protein [Halomicroarcula salinisoli]MBX0303431.1 helix-turn-helix domain-containing protein [Halomicroarcula salinisoli]